MNHIGDFRNLLFVKGFIDANQVAKFSLGQCMVQFCHIFYAHKLAPVHLFQKYTADFLGVGEFPQHFRIFLVREANQEAVFISHEGKDFQIPCGSRHISIKIIIEAIQLIKIHIGCPAITEQLIFIIIIANSARDKGYNDQASLAGATIRSSVVAAVGLLVIYGGLTYLGATTGTLADYQGLDQTTLLVTITKGLFGDIGVILLGIIVLFACWTTAIGLTSAVSEYFVELSGGKLKYKTLVIAIVVFSWLVSNAGVATIIKVSAPLLNLIDRRRSHGTDKQGDF